MNTLQLRLIALLIAMHIIGITGISTFAQPKIRAAAKTGTINPLSFCNGVSCPSAFLTTTTTPLRSINADMVTIEDNGSSAPSLPGFFGISSAWGNLWGVAFSGVTNVDLVNASGFTIGSTTLPGSYATLPLPQWQTQNPGPANDPDIAVGTCYSTRSSDYEHFALVVYEDNGEIYLEHYEINLQAGGTPPVATMPPAPFICPVPLQPCGWFNVRVHLSAGSNANGTAARPHIEIWHDRTNPTTNGLTLATKYAVVWDQEDPNTGKRQVWGIDGDIDQPGYILPTPNQPFLIGDGKQPDVVAINYYDGSGAAGGPREVAYVTYLDDNWPTSTGRDVLLSDWDYNTQTVNGTTTLNTASTANNDEFELPRISGPMYYNIGSPSSMDPICVVVVNDDDASVIDKVSAYKVYHSSIISPGPIVEKVDISDYNASDGFSSSSKIAIMPTVTGVGKDVANLAGLTAYDDYPAVFYSDHGGSSDGDFYAFGLKMDVNMSDPELYPSGPPEYWEVNANPLDNSSTAFSMGGVRPMIAVATANNTGYDLLTVYYEGDNSDRVMFNFTGTTTKYDFKPGKTTGVGQIGKGEYMAYPNPVSTQLNILHAGGASYIITDIIGKTILSGYLSSDAAAIEVAGFVSGMYLLHLSKDGHTEQVKFVKQ